MRGLYLPAKELDVHILIQRRFRNELVCDTPWWMMPFYTFFGDKSTITFEIYKRVLRRKAKGLWPANVRLKALYTVLKENTASIDEVDRGCILRLFKF